MPDYQNRIYSSGYLGPLLALIKYEVNLLFTKDKDKEGLIACSVEVKTGHLTTDMTYRVSSIHDALFFAFCKHFATYNITFSVESVHVFINNLLTSPETQ